MERNRVVITGMGAVTSIGTGADAFARALFRGKSVVTEISAFDPAGFAYKNGCEIDAFHDAPWVGETRGDLWGRTSHLAVAAAKMAVRDAGLNPGRLSEKGCDVYIGTTDGESQVIDELTGQWLARGFENASPDLFAKLSPNNLSAGIAREFRLKGTAVTMSTACAAGNYAIGYGYDAICSGEQEYVLCGGADSVCRKTFAGFYRLGTIAPDVCQPFSKDRKGILTGEGAGVLLLESLESAESRGAPIYAEVLGYGMNCNADHMTRPNRKRIVECIELAHKNAGIHPADVDYICAHGTGTVSNDQAESGAIRDVFDPGPPPASSIKSMIGHTMGAASALASIACVKAIEKGLIPPTINFEAPDPECHIDCVPNRARAKELGIVQNHGFAFGGNNCIIILGKYQAE